MQKLAALAFVLLSATACSKKAGGDACDGSIKHLMSLQGDEMKGAPPEMKTQMEAMMNKVSGAMIKSCVDTKWSKEVTDCLSAAKKMDDAKPCEEKLTPEQKTASDKAAEAAMADAPPMGGAMKKEAPPVPEGSAAPAPTPTEGSAAPAPAGSADGSAAAPEAK